MSPRMKLIARYGNGFGALCFGALVLYALGHGAIVIALFWALVCGLSVFNYYIFKTYQVHSSEEERLASELRTAELRRKMVGLTMNTPETVVRNHGP